MFPRLSLVLSLFAALSLNLRQTEAAWAVDFAIDLPPQPDARSGGLSNASRNDLSSNRETSDELQNAIDNAQRQLNSESAAKNLLAEPGNDSALDTEALDGSDNLEFNNEPSKGRLQKSPAKQSRQQAARTAVPSSDAFPEMSCLVNNVNFWESVYSETEETEMLVHDREDLSIIYAKISVPALHDRYRRQATMRAWKTKFDDLFLSISEKISSREGFSAEEQRVLKVVPKSKRTQAWFQQAGKNLRFQGGMKDRFYGGIQRSIGYMPVIHPILQSQNLPADIVHLPHVESSYIAHARSKVGAVGLWQLMPGTMRMLKGSAAVHRRTEVGISTLAAAKLLRENFETTQSWPLALTAYNHGLSGVMRAVRNTGSRDLCVIIEKYESPSFRFASSNFYAQFLAARNLALGHYQRLAKSKQGNRVLKEVLASHTKKNPS